MLLLPISASRTHGSPRMPENPSAVGNDGSAEGSTDQLDFADVSHRENDVDWNTYAASGRKLAICKATESNWYVDPKVAENREALGKQGLYCGLYHFAGSSADNEIDDPKVEAEYYVNQIGKLGPKEFPVLDFELAYHMSPTQQVSWIGKWCTEVQNRTGKTPWIYSYSGMLNRWDATDLTKYPLWLANYSVGSDPKNPPDGGSWPNLTAWQYTFKANVPGIRSTCDASYLYGDLPTLVESGKPAHEKLSTEPSR